MFSADSIYLKFHSSKLPDNPKFNSKDSVDYIAFSPAAKREEGVTAVALPWGTHPKYMKRILRKENKVGRSALAVVYNEHILSADPWRTLDCFDVVGERYHDEFKRRGIRPTHWHTSSLGLPVAINAIRLTGWATKTMRCVAPGGDLADAYLDGMVTQPYRKQLEAQGITRAQLKEIWKPLSPIEQAWRFSEATIDLRISLSDGVIPPLKGFEFAAALYQAGNHVNFEINRQCGHYGTLALEAA